MTNEFRTPGTSRETQSESRTTDPTGPPTSAPPPKQGIAKRFETEQAILITLVALSAIGIGITNFKPEQSFWFWVALVPVFGIASTYIAWSKSRLRGDSVARIIRIQLLHWISLIAAILVIYFLFKTTAQLSSTDVALITLLALALTTFLAGVHFDWRFMVIGIILGASAAGAVFVKEIIWMVIIPVAVALGLIVFWWKRKL